MSIASLEKVKQQIKGKTVVCIVAGANTDFLDWSKPNKKFPGVQELLDAFDRGTHHKEHRIREFENGQDQRQRDEGA